MHLNGEYVVLCGEQGEKPLIKELEAQIGRKLSKSKSASILEGRLPYVFSHIYFEFDKSKGLYIEVEPNEDSNGKIQEPDHPPESWIIRTRVRDDFEHINQEESVKYEETLVSSLSFSTIFLRHQE